MSTGRSRYSKIRVNSASEVWMSIPTLSSDWSGKNRRVWSCVKATSVPIEIAVDPEASDMPANQ
jgi:hypothetical protein